ncbi:putative integrase [Pseudomonas poae RE*1-1-14]|nr:putative integrase [Pseudomonas poae RE*1-1-14]
MREDGEQLGRFKVRSLIRELELVSKQPGSHAYKRATVERLDIPNTLNREFDVPAPNQVWCGDITYIWAQGKWHYLAVVLDLYARRIVGWALSEKPDAELVIKALDMAYEQRGRPSDLLFHSDSKNVIAICKPTLSPTVVAIPHAPEHEPTRKLLGFSVHYVQERQLNLTRAGIG